MTAIAALVVSFAVVKADAAAAASGGAKQRSILVLELKGDPGVVDGPTLQTITSTVSVAVSRRKGLSVLTAQDLKNLVDVEAQKQMLGCAPGTESCLAEVANAMGAELVLSGDVGKLGSSYVINLHLFDAGKAKSVGRDNLVVTDLAQLPQLLDQSIAGLLAPVTGEQGLTSKTTGVSIPTVDGNALKSGGLKAINMQAETALERALDAQDSKDSSPAEKRDAWCALAQVPGSNPYLGPAEKACTDWNAYIAASDELNKSVSADYATLSGFLQLKRKTKEQKLEAIDAFLQSYSRLDSEEVKNVQEARRRVKDGDDAELPVLEHTPPPDPNAPKPPPEPGMLDGCFDAFGCLALNFDGTPYLGLVLGTHLAVMDDIAKPDGFRADLPPSLVFGMRFSWAFLEAGANLDLDFHQGDFKVLDSIDDSNQNGFKDDVDGNSDADNDDDGVPDDVDVSPETVCAGGPFACGAEEFGDPVGTRERDAALFLHGYLGMQTVTLHIASVRVLSPSFGIDVYSKGFEKNDFGFYVANTFAFANVAEVRVFARSRIFGDAVVRGVQIGVEGSLDALMLFSAME